MSKIDQLTVEVNCQLTVPDNTADVCLKLLEEYLNQHPGKDIIGTRDESGRITFELRNRLKTYREEDQAP